MPLLWCTYSVLNVVDLHASTSYSFPAGDLPACRAWQHHVVTGVSTSPSSTNTQLLFPSPLNAARPAAQGNRVMEPEGLILIQWWLPVIISLIHSPFPEICQLWLLGAIYQGDHYIPILFPFPSLNIHFVGRQDCMEDGSLVWSSAPDFTFWALDSRIPVSQICRGTSSLFLQSCLLWVPPSPDGHKKSYISFCSSSTFSQKSSPKLLNITSRVTRHNGSHTPLNSKIAQDRWWRRYLQTNVASRDKLI